VNGAEGDDVIASICRSDRIADEYEKIILISSDRDFIQLQIDRPVTQYDAKGELVVPRITKAGQTINITPQQALMIKIISGDSSDNIKAIKPKIGETRRTTTSPRTWMVSGKCSRRSQRLQRGSC
jgi:5'-3' exonuclease